MATTPSQYNRIQSHNKETPPLAGMDPGNTFVFESLATIFATQMGPTSICIFFSFSYGGGRGKRGEGEGST